jgi:hypothetical protein
MIAASNMRVPPNYPFSERGIGVSYSSDSALEVFHPSSPLGLLSGFLGLEALS